MQHNVSVCDMRRRGLNTGGRVCPPAFSAPPHLGGLGDSSDGGILRRHGYWSGMGALGMWAAWRARFLRCPPLAPEPARSAPRQGGGVGVQVRQVGWQSRACAVDLRGTSDAAARSRGIGIGWAGEQGGGYCPGGGGAVRVHGHDARELGFPSSHLPPPLPVSSHHLVMLPWGPSHRRRPRPLLPGDRSWHRQPLPHARAPPAAAPVR
jgi:hypothetical protein